MKSHTPWMFASFVLVILAVGIIGLSLATPSAVAGTTETFPQGHPCYQTAPPPQIPCTSSTQTDYCGTGPHGSCTFTCTCISGSCDWESSEICRNPSACNTLGTACKNPRPPTPHNSLSDEIDVGDGSNF